MYKYTRNIQCHMSFVNDTARTLSPQLLGRICDQCLANGSVRCPDTLNYRNFGDDAAWTETLIDHKSYIAMTPESNRSPWCKIPGFNFESISHDFLHNCFLGVGRDFVASGIWLLIQQGIFSYVPGIDSLDDILGSVQLEMTATCKSAGFLFYFKKNVFHFPIHSFSCQVCFLKLTHHRNLWGPNQLRLYVPPKPALSVANLRGQDDYPSMSSRYKACHIKIFIWWLSQKSQHAADRSNGNEPRQVSVEEFHGMAPNSRHGEIYTCLPCSMF